MYIVLHTFQWKLAEVRGVFQKQREIVPEFFKLHGSCTRIIHAVFMSFAFFEKN